MLLVWSAVGSRTPENASATELFTLAVWVKIYMYVMLSSTKI